MDRYRSNSPRLNYSKSSFSNLYDHSFQSPTPIAIYQQKMSPFTMSISDQKSKTKNTWQKLKGLFKNNFRFCKNKTIYSQQYDDLQSIQDRNGPFLKLKDYWRIMIMIQIITCMQLLLFIQNQTCVMLADLFMFLGNIMICSSFKRAVFEIISSLAMIIISFSQNYKIVFLLYYSKLPFLIREWTRFRQNRRISNCLDKVIFIVSYHIFVLEFFYVLHAQLENLNKEYTNSTIFTLLMILTAFYSLGLINILTINNQFYFMFQNQNKVQDLKQNIKKIANKFNLPLQNKNFCFSNYHKKLTCSINDYISQISNQRKVKYLMENDKIFSKSFFLQTIFYNQRLLNKISNLLQIQYFLKNQFVVSQGQVSQNIFVLIKGQIKLEVQLQQFNRILDFKKQGVINENQLFDQNLSKYSAICEEDSIILVIQKESLNNILKSEIELKELYCMRKDQLNNKLSKIENLYCEACQIQYHSLNQCNKFFYSPHIWEIQKETIQNRIQCRSFMIRKYFTYNSKRNNNVVKIVAQNYNQQRQKQQVERKNRVSITSIQIAEEQIKVEQLSSFNKMNYSYIKQNQESQNQVKSIGFDDTKSLEQPALFSNSEIGPSFYKIESESQIQTDDKISRWSQIEEFDKLQEFEVYFPEMNLSKILQKMLMLN